MVVRYTKYPQYFEKNLKYQRNFKNFGVGSVNKKNYKSKHNSQNGGQKTKLAF